MLRSAFQQLDRILRGESTRLESLRAGNIPVSARALTYAGLLLGGWYGLCMGAFSLFQAGSPGLPQTLATTLKVPLLFLLTLIITFPSLYVFNALVGSQLRLLPLLRLLLSGLGVNLAVLASLGPIVAFFSASTSSYHFMVLLNVLVFAVSGFLGLGFLIRTLHRMSIIETGFSSRQPTPSLATELRQSPLPQAEFAASEAIVEPTREARDVLTPPSVVTAESSPFLADGVPSPTSDLHLPARLLPGPLEAVDKFLLQRHIKTVFGCWVAVYGLVGAQMGWVLRPFIGDPSLPFAIFRQRGSNFFQGLWETMVALFS